ncbi:FAD-dependent oxidoreductase [Sulfurimonas sp.]|uniref:FAD-dependent oxidoreductase n=1 Tax=Sulfurimonas sp. TaxID=2022749 RepID=UPI00260C61D4|nr:FAD-dependent oxidoreductase [Sulfurimonas sp.]
MRDNHNYDVIIIGGGISGTALLYTLAKYTNVHTVALFEKYNEIATVNSNAKSNSQTLHCGDIETNYTLEKAIKTNKTATMLENYGKLYGYQDKYMFKVPKMALGVGEEEVAYIQKRYEEFKKDFPYMKLYDKEALRELEPALLKGRDEDEELMAMGTDERYSAIDFGEMAKSFVRNAQKGNNNIDIHLNMEVETIEKIGSKYKLTVNSKPYFANYVVVDAGAHSLLLAHQMGHGEDYSCLPIGGSFYYSKVDILKSKVYTIQNPKLPFAAIHGDPDIVHDNTIRFGPTAIALPKLERYHHAHFIDFLESLSPCSEVVEVFYNLLADDDIREYTIKNLMYEIPGIRKQLFAKEVQKIVPSITEDDIEFAEGIGGLRPQVIDKKNKKLLLGEAKIDTGEGIVFNMTPSPGATSCLGNAYEDAQLICKYLNLEFKENQFQKELVQ